MSILIEDIPNITVKANENLEWVINNYEKLMTQYLNKYVAIDNGKIIESDLNLQELLFKIKEDKNYSKSTLIEFVSDKRNSN